MNDYNIVIGIRNKVPVRLSGPDYIVCDNSNYTVTLVTDGEWDEFRTKTVLFVLPSSRRNTASVLTEENACQVPVIQRPGTLTIGVTAGNIRTTRELELQVRPSVRTLAGAEAAEVPPDLAQQIIQRQDLLEERVEELEENGGGGDCGGVSVTFDEATGELLITSSHPDTVVFNPETGELTIGGAGGTATGTSFTPGNALELTAENVLNVKTTGDMESDNTLPITSAGTYTVVGNINALLDTI